MAPHSIFSHHQPPKLLELLFPRHHNRSATFELRNSTSPSQPHSANKVPV
jgi:hypothetical protein